MEIAQLDYSVKRIYKKIFLIIARKIPFIKGSWRAQVAKWGGNYKKS